MTTATPDAIEPASLEQLEALVVSSSNEYSHAYAKLATMKTDFDLRKTQVSSGEFQRLRSNLDQEQAIVEEKLRSKDRAEVEFADRYRRELAEKASGDRATRESALLAELQSLDIRLGRLTSEYRSIPNLIAATSDRKNAVLRELVTLKGQS
jgi:hypothetical protein